MTSTLHVQGLWRARSSAFAGRAARVRVFRHNDIHSACAGALTGHACARMRGFRHCDNTLRVQGFGGPCCARILTTWFATKERGTYWGMWNIAHNLGGFLAPIVAGTAARMYGWKYGACAWGKDKPALASPRGQSAAPGPSCKCSAY